MKGYESYKKVLNKKEANFIEKIKYWDMLKKDYTCQVKENSKKQDEIHNTKMELESKKTSLKDAMQRIKELNKDIKKLKQHIKDIEK